MTEDEQSKPEFDLVRICDAIAHIEREKENWELFFFSEFLNPARINYELFRNDVNTAIKFIGRHLNLSLARDVNLTIGFRRLSNKINDDWIARVNYLRSGHSYSDWQKCEDSAPRRLESVAGT